MVTSVANLRRRENMKLKPLRTKSKKAPIFKDDSEKKERDPTFWNLNKTKEVIQEYMERDERKIQGRDPKRKVISEEKWSEGNNWNKIVKEGEDRENIFLLQRENEEKEREAMTDKMLHIMVPRTQVLELVIPPQHYHMVFTKELLVPNKVDQYLINC